MSDLEWSGVVWCGLEWSAVAWGGLGWMIWGGHLSESSILRNHPDLQLILLHLTASETRTNKKMTVFCIWPLSVL